MKKTLRNDAGFTYVELMLVATIIAVLAAIAVPNFLEARFRSQVSRSKADLALLKMGMEAYRSETRRYPLNAAAGRPDPRDLLVLTTPISYVAHLPVDALSLREPPKKNQKGPAPRRYYHYLNGLQVNPEAGFIPDDPEFWPGGVRAAVLWGMGPSLEAWSEMPDAETTLTLGEQGRLSIKVYDPTNGTMSTGEIYAFLP